MHMHVLGISKKIYEKNKKTPRKHMYASRVSRAIAAAAAVSVVVRRVRVLVEAINMVYLCKL